MEVFCLILLIAGLGLIPEIKEYYKWYKESKN